ncbi:putative Heat shock protein 70kD [Rosa chinensis]|uniref:Putative Heat shock protein 70kD n=1 Tax=Rosa chinensis TaxID=74649 RepID=A0A2P6QXR1_ROSCH|nr:putative Heat shock protein 70kD [Rosa chinensis]
MEAKFALVDYMHTIKDMVSSDELKDLSRGHKKKIEVAVRKVRHWLEENQDQLAECEEYEDKREKLENTYNRIIAKNM